MFALRVVVNCMSTLQLLAISISFGSMSEFLATPLASCSECGQLRAALDEARKQIANLQAQIHELRAQLNRNSSNSSTPPSANPPGAPKPVNKTPTGRKPGGQPGHQGHHRHRLPPERVNTIVPYVPTVCEHCHTPLSAEPGPGDPEPTWHQVAELPELAAIVTEHQGHARTCSCCGRLNRGVIPPEVRAHTFGPRLAATMSYFAGRHHIGRRGVEEIVETVFEVPTSLGSISAMEAEMSDALASPYQEAQEAVREAPVKNTDETGWSEKGQKRWLWGAATATVAFFVIHLRRSYEGLQALLGETPRGIVGSDRWSAYSKLPLELRQICWAHLKRDFQKLIDRGGPADAIGRACLEVVDCLFADWWAFRNGQIDRAALQARVDRIGRANSRGFWSRVIAARIPRRRRSAPTCWRCTRRCGCSPRSRGSSPRTTMRSASCDRAFCGGRTPSAATAPQGAGLSKGC